MNRGVKVALVVVAVACVLGLSVCGAGYYWLSAKKDELLREGEQMREEGRVFAKTTDQRGCLVEVLARSRRDCPADEIAGAFCRGKLAAFLSECLDRAREAPGLCAGAPPESELLETVTWSLARCEELGHADDQSCARLVRVLATRCAHRTTAAPPP